MMARFDLTSRLWTWGCLIAAIALAVQAGVLLSGIGTTREAIRRESDSASALLLFDRSVRHLEASDIANDRDWSLLANTAEARLNDVIPHAGTDEESRGAVTRLAAKLEAVRTARDAAATRARQPASRDSQNLETAYEALVSGVDAELQRSKDSRVALLARLESQQRWLLILVGASCLLAIAGAAMAIRFQGEFSDRWRQHAATRQKDERYRMLVEHASDGIFIVDRNATIVDANASGFTMLGAPPGELAGLSLRDLIVADASSSLLRRLQDLKVGETAVTEGRFRRRDGTELIAEASLKNLPDGSLQIVLRDVTARHVADESRRESEETARKHQEALLRLGKLEALSVDGIQAALTETTEVVADAIRSARIGVWLFTSDETKLRCADEFDLTSSRHGSGLELDFQNFPDFFKSLTSSRVIDAHDACHDPRTRDLDGAYLRPNGVTSMLAAAVRSAGRVLGAVFIEHVGAPRRWKPEEQAFASSIADLVSLTLEQWERIQAEQALRLSEEYFRSLIESASDIITILDGKGDIRYASPSVERLLGLPPETLVGRNVLDLVPEEDASHIRRLLEEAPSNPGPAAGFEFRLRSESGAWRTLDATVNNLLDDPAVGGIVVNSRDITDRIVMERELEERVRLANFGLDISFALTRSDSLSMMFQRSADAMAKHLGGAFAGIWTLASASDGMLELQAAAGSHQGIFPSQARTAVGKSAIGAIAHERRPRLVDFSSSSTSTEDRDWAARAGLVAFAGYPLIVEDRLVGVMAIFAPTPLSNTTLIAMASVADEMALGIDHARASDALRASEVRFRSIVTNALDGIITLDDQARIESYNDAAQAIFGYEARDIVGRPLEVLVPGLASEAGTSAVDELRSRAIGRVTEWEGRRNDGSVFPLEISLYEFEIPDGTYIAMSARDVSERREVDRLKSEFVSTVSHELRTPLTSIRGSMSLLAAGVLGKLPPDASDVVNVAARNTERLVTLINDILDLDRLAQGKMELHLETVSVSTLFRRSIDAVRAFAEQASIILQPEDSVLRVTGDGDRLVQVIVNLLSNAVKFSPAGGTVTLSAGERDGLIEIRVADHGRGIPPSFHESIFEPFHQVEGTDARERGGTGLGLAICRAIVEQHRGTIGVSSEEGAGSTFWFRVPGAVDDRTGFEIIESSSVLVLAPEAAARTGIAEILNSETLHAVCTESIADAREALDQYSIAILVLDASAPHLSAFSLLHQIRSDERLDEIPVVCIDDGAGPRLDDDRTVFISAPVDAERLLTAIQLAASKEASGDVLLVDDDEAMLDVMQRQLSREGISSRTAVSGREAVQLARSEAPGVLVLDIGLPEGDGYDVVEALRREPRLNRIPLLVYTGRDLSGFERHRLQLGPTRFLTKSKATNEDFRELVVGLLRHLDQAGTAREDTHHR